MEWLESSSSSAETKLSSSKTELKRRVMTESLWNKYDICITTTALG